MDSRELVIRALEFDRPSRILRQLWTLPRAEFHYPAFLSKIRQDFPGDLGNAPGHYRQCAQTQGDPYQIGTYLDGWGCLFENRQTGVIGEVNQPLNATWEEAGKLRFLEEMLSVDFTRSFNLGKK